MTKDFTKTQWLEAFNTVLNKPIGNILKTSDSDKTMMEHVYPADKFLETLPWIEEHFGYKTKDQVTKGIVFTLGIATLSQLLINYLNEETA